MSIPSLDVGMIWRREALLLACLLTAAAIIGLLVGALWPCLLLAGGLYLGMHMLHAYQLHRWLVAERGRLPNGFGIWQEIFAELYRLKQRNRQRKKRLNNIVQEFRASTAALPDGVVVLDRLGRIVWLNQAAGVLLTLRNPQDIGQRIVNLLRMPGFVRFVNQGAEQISELEATLPNNDQSTILLRLIPYGNQQQLLMARDISAQKQLDTMRRDFVANASHELRTPLTVLRGYLDMMHEDSAEQAALAQWRKPIVEMVAQARRMDHIIASLLELARLESEGAQQEQTRVDMPELIHTQAAQLRATAAVEHDYQLEIDEALLLYGRSEQLQSIVANLLANAIRYTGANGRIRVAWWQDEQGAHLSVTDNGIGIKTALIPRLTERFYRADAARDTDSGGIGLGLAIVRHCLEHHEAELSINSSPGRGSSFVCSFPLPRTMTRASA